MKQLFVTSGLSNLLLGGLLAVARADGVVKPEEMDALRATARDLGLTMPEEEDLLLAEDVTADALAAAVSGGPGAYRTAGSTPDEIGQAFLAAALRLALADQELVIEEVTALREFAAALGTPTAGIADWHVIRDHDASPTGRS